MCCAPPCEVWGSPAEAAWSPALGSLHNWSDVHQVAILNEHLQHFRKSEFFLNLANFFNRPPRVNSAVEKDGEGRM